MKILSSPRCRHIVLYSLKKIYMIVNSVKSFIRTTLELRSCCCHKGSLFHLWPREVG